MPGRQDPASLLADIEDIKQRLRHLESAPQQPHRSQRGGSFVLIPEDGNPDALMIFGTFGDGDGVTQFGVSLYDKNGSTILGVAEDDEGLIFPHMFCQWTIPTAQSITSASFIQVAEAEINGTIVHDCMYFSAGIITPVGTTGEVRVTTSGGGGNTNTLTIPSNTNASVICKWLHPCAVGWGDTTSAFDALGVLQYEVRRTGGGGTVTAYPPRGLQFCNGAFQPGASASVPLTLA